MFLYILTQFRNIAYKLLQAVGPLQLDLVAWFARGSCMQPARLGQRPTLVNTQGPIKLRCACYVTVADQCALLQPAQLAVIDLLPAVGPTDLRSRQQKPVPICTHFWKKCHYFRNDDPYRHKTQYMSCIWSSLTRLCAKFGHRTTRRLGAARPQTK